MLKIQQIFPKLYRCLLYVVFFYNLEPQNAELVGVKNVLMKKKDQRIFSCAKMLKISIIKNVNGSEDTLMHKAERPCTYFFQLFYTY